MIFPGFSRHQVQGAQRNAGPALLSTKSPSAIWRRKPSIVVLHLSGWAERGASDRWSVRCVDGLYLFGRRKKRGWMKNRVWCFFVNLWEFDNFKQHIGIWLDLIVNEHKWSRGSREEKTAGNSLYSTWCKKDSHWCPDHFLLQTNLLSFLAHLRSWLDRWLVSSSYSQWKMGSKSQIDHLCLFRNFPMFEKPLYFAKFYKYRAPLLFQTIFSKQLSWMIYTSLIVVIECSFIV